MTHEVRLGAQGRLVIPSSVRDLLGLRPGDRLSLRVEDGHVILERRDALLARLQSLFDHLPGGVSLADELITERRAESGTDGAG